jgi:hypothetical protein
VVVPDQDRAFGFGPESYHWSLQAAGFSIGEVRHKSLGWPRCTMWMIPYWSILILLILLSAWLFLSKPRTKPEWMIEPSAENT